MYNIFLTVHITVGFIALITGLTVIFAPKGKTVHIKAGRVYFWSMLGVAVTAILLSLMRINLFLLLIALFSFYLAWSGYRAVRWKNKVLPPKIALFDWVVVPFMLLIGIAMAGLALAGIAGFSLPSKLADTSFILLLFGVIFMFLASRNLVMKLNGPSSNTSNWIYEHIQGMLAAYIATCTAFLVVNGSFLPAFVAWTAPTFIGSILIAYFLRKYRRAGKSATKKA